MSRARRRLIQIFVAAALILLVASAGVAVWLDRKLADPRLAGDVAARLSEAIGAEVRVQSLDFLWPGWIEIEGASVRLEDDAADRPLLDVHKIHVLVSPMSLLDRRLHCLIVQIARPTFAFRLRADGTFALPRKIAGAGTDVAKTGDAIGPKAEPPPDGRGTAWLAAIDRHSLSDATFMLFEADGSRSFLGEGVDLHGRFHVERSGAGGTARLSAERVTLKNGTAIEDLAATLTITNGVAHLADATAEVDGASVQGELASHQVGATRRFDFSANVAHVARRHIEKFFDLPDYLTFDEADATVRGEGDLENPETVTAAGRLTSHDTRISANQLLNLIGLGVAYGEWDSIRFGDTTANLTYSNSWFRITDIATDSAVPTQSASGHVGFGPAGKGAANLAWTLPLCGGKLEGTFRYDGDAATMPFAARITMQRARLRDFLSPFEIRAQSRLRAPKLDTYLQGRVTGTTEITGDLRQPGGVAKGSASIDSLTVALERLLQDLGVPADLPDLRSVAFGPVAGALSMTNRVFRLENFRSAGKNSPPHIETGFASGPGGLAAAHIALDLPLWKGRVNARLEQKPGSGSRRPFTVSLRCSELDTPDVLRSFRSDPGSLEGRTTLDFSGAGDLAAIDRLEGSGSLAMRPARLKKVKTFNILSSLLTMPNLGSFDLDSLEADYRVANRTVTFSEIRTKPESRDHFDGRGTIGFDGALDLKGTLVVNSGAPGFVGNTLYALGLKANRGFIQVPFTVTGKAGNPKVKIDAPGLAGSAATTVIDHIPLINRLPGLFRKRETKPTQAEPKKPPPGKR